MDLASDIAVLIRNLVGDTAGGQGGPTLSLNGRVAGYSQSSGVLQVNLTHYYQADGVTPVQVEVPIGLFMAGGNGDGSSPGYGDYFCIEAGTLITLSLVEAGTGELVSATVQHDALNPPALLNGSPDPSPNAPSIKAPLLPGERLIFSKRGFLIRFFDAGGIQMGSFTNGGQVPAAVEGSIIDPTALLTTLANYATSAASAAVPNDGGRAAFTAFALSLTTLIATKPVYLEPTDALAWVDSEDHDPVVGSGGAQSILLPGAGED